MKITTPKRKRMERIVIRSQKKTNRTNNQENIPLDLEDNYVSPTLPNRLSPNILIDISNETESPRVKRMRMIKEKQRKKKQAQSSTSRTQYMNQTSDQTSENSNKNGNMNDNEISTCGTPSKDQASSSHSQNCLYNSKEYNDNGDANYICEHCGAILWFDERIEKRRVKGPPKFSLCCMHGKIDVPPPPKPPQKLLDLMFKGDSKSKNFMENIRPYNSTFAFTCMGGTIDTSVNKGRGPNVFRLQGQNHHMIGSLLPPPGEPPRFNQLYIQDTENENENRIKAFSSKRTTPLPRSKILRDDIMEDIKSMLNECNPYAKILRSAKERFKATPSANVKLKLSSRRTTGGDTYNLPTTSEVAALYSGDFDIEMKPRDIVLETMDGTFKRISELHAGYLPLQYPLLFPCGEDGYHIDLHLKKTTKCSKSPRTTLSMREFFAFTLMERPNVPTTLMSSGKLFQQFLVDGLTMIEAERIGYLKINQKALRADKYANVAAAAAANKENDSSSKVGRPLVLPSTFIGSARCMQQRYMDAMAVCQHFGYPDLFITFTRNPKWPEITRHLQVRGHQAIDRADIVARTFKIKLDNLIVDIKQNNVFGPAAAVIYTIEFQKRGLPHAHILLFLKKGSKLKDPNVVDGFVCAEIPDEASNPTLYNVVKETMMHGPCGLANPNSPCMEKGKCTKRFPKDFINNTCINKDGFPNYKRRNDLRSVEKNGTSLDNRYVIPYNLYLLLKYQAHINVEWCSESKAIKYLFKYMHKGNDRVSATISRDPLGNDASSSENAVDEIKQFYDFRYIAPCEAAWRIFGFETHYSSVPILRLNYHLEGEHSITYADDDEVHDILAKEGNQTSQMLQWMVVCSRNDDAKKLLYAEFPSHFVWKKTEKEWTPRKRNVSFGRIHHASLAAGERFYLRMLLNNVRGPTCFEDLRTAHGVLYLTYKEACHALGLLDDDKQYIDAITEASQWGSAHSMRRIFVTLLISESLSTPDHVWFQTWHLLSEDILYMQRRIRQSPAYMMSDDQIQNQTLLEIEKLLQYSGSSSRNFTTMPFPENNNFPANNRLITDELCYDRHACEEEYQRLLPLLTAEQRNIFERIMAAVDSEGGVFFVYGFGGTGKTFLWKTLSTYIRSKGEIVVNVASSAMAALLLEGGRTAHSQFSIPIQVNETSTCNITLDSDIVGLLDQAKLIIWDEAPMMHKHCFEAVDRSLKDILNNTKPFGGKTVVFGGDFRQIQPVIPKGSREQIVQASLSSSSLWNSCQVLQLTKNMRLTVESDPLEVDHIAEFSEWILKLGDGRLSEPNDGESVIEIPEDMLLKDSLDPINSIAVSTYPSLLQNLDRKDYFKERAILCPTNDVVDEVNNYIMDLLPGESSIYLSSDKICNSDSSKTRDKGISTEFLNAIKSSGLPNHTLKLKRDVPVMLLRNIDQKYGLCNGTRLQIMRLGHDIIEAKVLTDNEPGSSIGEQVFIPRIAIIPTDSKLPFCFQRNNFQ